MLACSCVTTPSNNTVDFKEIVAPIKPHSVQVWDLLESVSGLHHKGEQTKRLYSQKYLMNFGIYFEKSHAPRRGHQFNKSLRSVTNLERRESLHWLHPDSRPGPASHLSQLAFPLQLAAEKACQWFQVFIQANGLWWWILLRLPAWKVWPQIMTPNIGISLWFSAFFFLFFYSTKNVLCKAVNSKWRTFPEINSLPRSSDGIGVIISFSCFHISVCISPSTQQLHHKLHYWSIRTKQVLRITSQTHYLWNCIGES